MKYWLIAAVAIIMAACNDDIEHKLEGKWQLQQVEADGEVILADTVFYNFQNVLFMYQVYLPDSNMYVLQHGFNTLKDENQLTLELSNVPRQATNFIKYTDWKETVRTFTIEESNRKHLILNSEGKRYTFRKF
ncbi:MULTISPECIES: lipocalin-like domain-containing protein [Parabacteroides]|uniref:lipocalin-like domain-containing protein n=1 Tax=Parabacteroides timonensis TaxID=1871013 RepID=UPI00094EE10D|nr:MULTISPECIES: lipocalin-like domain-containing protein [Parabacteroides]